MNLSLKSNFLLAIFSILLLTTTASAQYNPESFSAMKWRLVGPHRAGRVTAVAGIPGKPAIYYFGTPGGGKTWMNVGLRSTHHISSLIVDPRNPNIVLAGSLDFFNSSTEKGIFKTTDGGKTWKNVLFKDDKTSIMDMCAAPDDPRIIYAATYTFQYDPNNRRNISGDSQVYKSTDEG